MTSQTPHEDRSGSYESSFHDEAKRDSGELPLTGDGRELAASEIEFTDDSFEIPQSDLTPIQIGRYEVIRQIGEGGFGRVYLALDPTLNRKIAIKMPLAAMGAYQRNSFFRGRPIGRPP